MAEFDFGLPLGLSVSTQADQRINDLRYDEQALNQIKAQNAAKRSLFLSDLDYQNAQNQFDNPLIKEKFKNKLYELGAYIRQNPDWNTNVDKMMTVKVMKNGFKDDPDLIRGVAFDSQKKELIKDMQEAAKDPTYKDLGAYEDQLQQFRNYEQTGNKFGDKSKGIDPPSYVRPRDFSDLVTEANNNGSKVAQNQYTMDYVPIKNGRVGAYDVVPKKETIEALAQQQYRDHKRQYDIQYKDQALNEARKHAALAIKGDRFEGWDDAEGKAKRLMDYEYKKKAAMSSGPATDPWKVMILDPPDTPVKDEDVASVLGAKPNVIIKGPDGKNQVISGKRFYYERLTDQGYRGKGKDGKAIYSSPKNGIKDAFGYVLYPYEYGVENGIIETEGNWSPATNKEVINPDFKDSWEILQPDDPNGKPMLKARGRAQVNANALDASIKFNSLIHNTTKRRENIATGESLISEGKEYQEDADGNRYYKGIDY